MVEFAVVLPILSLLLFGMIDFGLTLNDYQSVRQAVREGAREGSVLSFSGGCTSGTTAQKIACTVEERAGLGADRMLVKVVGPAKWDKDSSVLVCGQAKATSTTGFTAPFLDERWLRSKIRVRIEKEGAATSSTPEDASGAEWSWCN